MQSRQARTRRRTRARPIALEGAWDALASSYRRQLWLERVALRKLSSMLGFDAESRLLDVGTGTAALLATVAKADPRPSDAVGVDSSAEMMALAPPLPTGWELLLADAGDLPFEDSSFDFVTAAYLLHFLEPLPRARILSEIGRVLRPGGKLGLITVAEPGRGIGSRLWAPLTRPANDSSGRFAGMRPLDPGPELELAGFAESARATTRLGYPSLCLTAVRGAQSGDGNETNASP